MPVMQSLRPRVRGNFAARWRSWFEPTRVSSHRAERFFGPPLVGMRGRTVCSLRIRAGAVIFRKAPAERRVHGCGWMIAGAPLPHPYSRRRRLGAVS